VVSEISNRSETCEICKNLFSYTFDFLSALARPWQDGGADLLYHSASLSQTPPEFRSDAVPAFDELHPSVLIHKTDRCVADFEDREPSSNELKRGLARGVAGSARYGIDNLHGILPESGHACGYRRSLAMPLIWSGVSRWLPIAYAQSWRRTTGRKT